MTGRGRGRGRPILGQGSMSRPGDIPGQSTVTTQPATSFSTGLSADAVEFVPRNHVIAPSVPDTPHEEEIDPIDILRQTIFLLTEDPASFQESVTELVLMLQDTVHDEGTLQEVVEELFNQCVTDANFRYSGVRVCHQLSQDLSVQFTSGNFRQHFLKRCHAEHQKREEMITQSEKRAVGFTLFMSEMLVNFTIGNNDRLKILADAVQDLLVTMLSHRSETTLKCAAQVLKLCGSILSQFEKSQNESSTPKLDSVLSKLKLAVVDNSISKGVRSLLLSVLELRAGNWGEHERLAADMTSQAPAAAQPAFDNNPVFYSSSGQVLASGGGEEEDYTDEELAQNAAFYDQYDQTGDPAAHEYTNQFSNDDEYDDEIAAAYEEFLLSQQGAAKPWSTTS